MQPIARQPDTRTRLKEQSRAHGSFQYAVVMLVVGLIVGTLISRTSGQPDPNWTAILIAFALGIVFMLVTRWLRKPWDGAPGDGTQSGKRQPHRLFGSAFFGSIMFVVGFVVGVGVDGLPGQMGANWGYIVIALGVGVLISSLALWLVQAKRSRKQALTGRL